MVILFQTRRRAKRCTWYTQAVATKYEAKFGGLKWTRTIDWLTYVKFCEFDESVFLVSHFCPFLFHKNGGLKWTRTIDLTLIRRAL